MGVEMEQLLDDTHEIGSFPAIVNRINIAIADPRSSLDAIAAIINEDPGLSARLMKIANSSFYGFPFPVDTITRAMTVVGTRQLKDLVLATYAIDLFAKVPENLVDVRSFWYHSIACGVMSRVIATAIRDSNLERYYLCGLLHDIGHIILFVRLPEQATTFLKADRAGSLLIHHAEEQALGFNHADLGGRLMERWLLPADIHVPIRNHHAPHRSTDHLLETAVLHVAEIMANCLLGGGGLESRLAQVDADAWKRINLPESAVPSLMDIGRGQLSDAIKLFFEE
ncbi:MAG: HDOD domain-containing protein [Magnetococcales bacterium]|nr:HDOD domain-containing protein [Magnetococcales bacterium]